MGVLNVTPDSFSDGGRFFSHEAAVARARQMMAEGAHLIDVGGESTRPGSEAVGLEEELRRVMPVLEALQPAGIPVSVDTWRAETARRALAAGAVMVNDITGLRGDPEMAEVVAESGCACVVMHMQGTPRTMQQAPVYNDVVEDLCAFFEERIAVLTAAGVGEDQIWLDPGFGFGKTVAHNLELLRRLCEFKRFGRPLLVGTSNKSTIGKVLEVPVDERLEGTAATVAVSICNGADAVRVHDVRAMARVARMTDAIVRGLRVTGEAAHKEHAYLLASFFLDHHLPTDAERLGLDDHGCEVIGGLSEVYLIAEHEDPEQAARWRPRIHQMLDRILEVGRDENGLLYNAVNPVTGEVLSEDRTDNWGYNYNAFALVAMIDGVERYEQAVKHVMANMPAQKDYPWEGDKADGIADSLEGGLNLLNRFPSEEMAAWADYMAQRLLSKQRDTGIIEGWHGDGNSARTAIMYALWKSLGAYVQPWRADVRVGAVQDPRGVVHFVVASDWPWEGTLHFDLPRHQEYLKLPLDYPRLNQFPEWFTVQREYTLYLTDTSSFPRVDPEEAAQAHEYHKQPDTPYQYKVDAESLRAGIPVAVSAEQPYQLTLWPLALPRPGEMQDLPGYIERVM